MGKKASGTAAPATQDGRKIGQRGKPAIVGIEQKTPGQYIHGQGDNLFIDARREDGTITCISLRSSPNRCKADLIEALNWMPEEVMLANWRYFSVLLAKIDQSKPFRRLASPQLATTAKKLRHLNPVVNVPPTALVQPMVAPVHAMTSGTGATAASAAGTTRGGDAATSAQHPQPQQASPPRSNDAEPEPRSLPGPPPTNGLVPRSFSTSALASPALSQTPAPSLLPPPPPPHAQPSTAATAAPVGDAPPNADVADPLARVLHVLAVQTRAIAELTMANRTLAAEVAGLRADVGILSRAVASGVASGSKAGGQAQGQANGRPG